MCIVYADKWEGRTDENFFPTLKHRQREGRLEADPPLPKETSKRWMWGPIDQRQVCRKEGCASVIVVLFCGHGRSSSCFERHVTTDACGQGVSREDPGRIAVAQEQLEQLIEGYVRRRTAFRTNSMILARPIRVLSSHGCFFILPIDLISYIGTVVGRSLSAGRS
jgi:hypothetical protein